MLFGSPYPWYIEPPAYGILNPLPMVYIIPYPWYIEPPIHDISNPLPISRLGMRGFKISWWVQFTKQGNSVFNKKVQYTMGFNIPYATGFVTRLIRRVPLLEQELLTLPEHLSSPLVFSGARVTRSLVLCVCFVDHCLSVFFWPLCCLFFFDLRILWYLQTLCNCQLNNFHVLYFTNIIPNNVLCNVHSSV